MPNQPQFTQLMLLFQVEPQFVLLCSTTNMNLHLGTMIRDNEYGANNTFDKYMLHNVNHKLALIQREGHVACTVQHKLNLHSYYTTSLAARKH